MKSFSFNENFILKKDILSDSTIFNELAKKSFPLSKYYYRDALLNFSFGSSKLEGATLNKLDTFEFIKKGTFADYKFDNKSDIKKEKDNIIGNKRVFELLINGKINLTIDNIIKIHDLIDCENKGIANTDRNVFVNNGLYKSINGEDSIISKLEKIIEISNEIKNPFKKAIYLHCNIAYLQPFNDGNKRTARLVCNIPLFENNLPLFLFDNNIKSFYLNELMNYYENGEFSARFKFIFEDDYQNSINRYNFLMREIKVKDETFVLKAIKIDLKILNYANDDFKEKYNYLLKYKNNPSILKNEIDMKLGTIDDEESYSFKM